MSSQIRQTEPSQTSSACCAVHLGLRMPSGSRRFQHRLRMTCRAPHDLIAGSHTATVDVGPSVPAALHLFVTPHVGDCLSKAPFAQSIPLQVAPCPRTANRQCDYFAPPSPQVSLHAWSSATGEIQEDATVRCFAHSRYAKAGTSVCQMHRHTWARALAYLQLTLWLVQTTGGTAATIPGEPIQVAGPKDLKTAPLCEKSTHRHHPEA